jgi:hypothetical protein
MCTRATLTLTPHCPRKHRVLWGEPLDTHCTHASEDDMHVRCSHADDMHMSSVLAASQVERTGGEGSAEQGQRRGHERSAGLVA